MEELILFANDVFRGQLGLILAVVLLGVGIADTFVLHYIFRPQMRNLIVSAKPGMPPDERTALDRRIQAQRMVINAMIFPCIAFTLAGLYGLYLTFSSWTPPS